MYQITHLFIGKEEYEEDAAYFEALDKSIKVIVIADSGFTLPQGSRMQLFKKPFYILPIINILNANATENMALYT